MKHPRTCAITGATGYVGSRIKRYLARHGFEAYELTRNPVPSSPFWVAYALTDPVDVDVLADIDILIHCAYDFRPTTGDEINRTNIQGSARLFEAAKASGIETIIAMSSMSAFPECRSLYGRAKLAIEAEAAKHSAVIIRPGLIFGPDAGGAFGALVRAASRKVIPLIGKGDQTLFLAHEDDLCRLVLEVCLQPTKHVGTPIIAACEKAKTLRMVLETLARAKGGSPMFLPVPWQLAWGGLFLTEKVGLRLRPRSDGVISLLNRNPDPDFGSTRSIGVRFREFSLESLLE